MIGHIYSRARQGKQTQAHFYSSFLIYQHQERSVAALLEECKEMDSRQERNGNHLWRKANLSCLQISPLSSGMEGWQGGGFSH